MRARLISLLVGILFLAGCMEGQKPEPLPRYKEEPKEKATKATQKTLYERLGGEQAIAKVVDDFLANFLADERLADPLKKHVREGDPAALKKKLVEQIGEATGGPQKYTGRSMKEAHKGMGITDADFNAVVADLEKALDANRVGAAEKKELLALLEKLRPEVVEKPE